MISSSSLSTKIIGYVQGHFAKMSHSAYGMSNSCVDVVGVSLMLKLLMTKRRDQFGFCSSQTSVEEEESKLFRHVLTQEISAV